MKKIKFSLAALLLAAALTGCIAEEKPLDHAIQTEINDARISSAENTTATGTSEESSASESSEKTVTSEAVPPETTTVSYAAQNSAEAITPSEFTSENGETYTENAAEEGNSPVYDPKETTPQYEGAPEMEFMRMEDGTAKFIIKNPTPNEYYYGLEPCLEVKTADGWEEVPVSHEVCWIEIAIVLEPYSENEYYLPLMDYYDLPPRDHVGEFNGEYRASVNLSSENGNETVCAEFGISVIID